EPTTLPKGAVSLLTETGTRHERLRIIRAILKQAKSRLPGLDKPAEMMNEWWRNCIHRPARVQITSQDYTFTGITRSIDEEGAVLLEMEDHTTRRIRDGTLRVLDDLTG
ncbi:MAG TPA: hypothetical protein VE955_09230, partial [Candidatus Dormibacteraeota bacterium]|nr:hypothetical protein [Candidatus Dormibacteraeota bacterium]